METIQIKCGAFEGEIEETDCPLCRPNAPAPRLLHRMRSGIGFHRCPSCGLHFASPRFTEASLLAIYENEAFADLSYFDEPWSYERWRAAGDRNFIVSALKADLVSRFLPPGGRLLDVGCGAGLFCLEAAQRGFRVEGIEPSARIVEIARRVTNLPIHHGTIESYDATELFDGVIAWDVLEHVYDPLAMTRRAASFLKPGGFLFVQVPNHEGISNYFKSLLSRIGLKRSDYGHFGFPWHVYSFNLTSLLILFEKNNLLPVLFESWSHRMKEGERDLVSRFVTRFFKETLLSDYLTAVAEKR